MSQTTPESAERVASTPTDAEPSLAVDLAGLTLANPMMTASGTCGYAFEYAPMLDFSQLGAWVTKSITAEVRPGNETYRIVETRGGMLNAIGLANVGLDKFLSDKLPQLVEMRQMGPGGEGDTHGPRIIVNVAGHSVEDYVSAAGRIAEEAIVDAIELNVSCPNVSDGLVFGTDPVALKELVKVVRDAMRDDCKLIIKLSPNTGDVPATAVAAIEGGCDVLSMINTYTAMAVDINKRTTRLANGTGGLSGPAVKPLAVYLVHKVYREVARDAGVPIIGMGGIQYWQDAVEFLLAGATGLAVGTALFVDPATPVKIQAGLKQYLRDQGCSSINDIIGTLKLPGE